MGGEIVDGDGGMIAGSCPNSEESPALNATLRSLVLAYYFPDRTDVTQACKHNSAPLMDVVITCYYAHFTLSFVICKIT